ncbi:MAG: hypothetical protein ACJAWA_001546, partial [Nonlabens sp.]
LSRSRLLIIFISLSRKRYHTEPFFFSPILLAHGISVFIRGCLESRF